MTGRSPGITSSRICPYYLRSSCREGDKCIRSHDITNWTPDKIPLCRYYLTGECKYNTECWYSHGATGGPSKQPSEEEKEARKEYLVTPIVDGEPVYTITVVPTRQPKKKPFKGKTYADSLKSNLQNGVKGLSKSQLCPYHVTGNCPFMERCRYIHGNLCDICTLNCLHPYNRRQRNKHKGECMKELERNIAISNAVQKSREKQCGICLDLVIEKEAISERHFGILEKCTHVFCLECIRKWRRVKQFEGESILQTVINPIVTRACPQCRVPSNFVIPSLFWVEGEAKEKLLVDYKSALGRKHCKYFKRGEGDCPFGGVCFYLHADAEGNKVELPPPLNRRRYNRSSDVDFMAVYSLIDYMEEHEEEEIDWLTLDELLGFIEEVI